MPEVSVFAFLGMSAVDERIYHVLIGAPSAPVADVAHRCGVSAATVRRTMARLGEFGLLRRREGVWEVVEPQSALGSRVREQQAMLDKVVAVAGDLSAVFAAARLHATPSDLIQPLRADQVGPALVDLLSTATRTVHATATPPYVVGPDPVVESAETACLARGVAFRALYHTSALDDATHVANLQRMIAAGEQARVVPVLRTKMVLIDGSTALLPLARKAVDGQVHAVVVSHSALSAALGELFDMLWASGSPVALGDSVPIPRTGPDRNLLQLLASGMSDAAIARHYRISKRTLRRRVETLELQLAATNRFHLGVLAAQRKLL